MFVKQTDPKRPSYPDLLNKIKMQLVGVGRTGKLNESYICKD
jgi:hypothetical protein